MTSLPRDLLLALTNHDAEPLRDLFAALGYTRRERIVYTAQTLDWPDTLAAELLGRGFELLADVDAGAFQVLLLPPAQGAQGLTLALQRRLYRTFEERLNEGLLVLPNSDWDLFELVLLVDTRTQEQRDDNLPMQFPRWSFDPRALRPHQQRALELLDVHGLADAEAGQHVLRAFGRAQQETLFRSQGFFSSYYLEQRIDDADAEIAATWRGLLGQTAALRLVAEQGQPRQILAALGWELLLAAQGGGLFTLRSGTTDAAILALLPEGAPLEQATDDGDYPQLALIAALEQHKKHKQPNGISWGILTNGRVWRLYSTLTSSISGVHYEVDLHDLLQFGDQRDLRLFSGFFGAAGLASGFARQVFYASQTLAKQVGENLKKTIFEQVFEELANGIAYDMWRRGTYTGADDQRRLIFRATLVLLYRILFLLYAESRRLLPTLHVAYYGHSLTRLLTDIAIQPFLEAHNRRPLGPDAPWAWDWLRDLCDAVNTGRKDWGVPRYNGGLFSAGQPNAAALDDHKAAHRLLADVRIGALFLHKALDLLGRDQAARNATTVEGARRLIDYAALDVRRLGSIYEGLLEYQLEESLTPQPPLPAAGEGQPRNDGRMGEPPRLTLPRTHGGRKASGSYYTPDYIVAYIVEQAVGPVLAEREQRFADMMPQIQAARTALRREETKIDNPRYDLAIFRRHQRDLRELELAASEALLDLKVLDPAMGSGHFLVETVDFLSDRLLGIMRRFPDNPLRARLEAIRADIRASLQAQGVEAFITDEQLSDARLLRRLVMKRCVYGVDLNDMAVELARLSLWLHSFTVGAPLSFLDHHLKWGNSLIGARAQAVQSALESVKTGQAEGGDAFQYDLFGQDSAFAEMLNLAGMIEQLVQIADANGQQVEQSAQIYADYEQRVVPVKRLLDVWVAQFFGSKDAAQVIKLYTGSRKDVGDLITALMGGTSSSKQIQSAADQSRALFTQHRFLHWDLDFPEVFIDLQRRTWKDKDAAGFDAVVGNPPYDVLAEKERDEDLSSLMRYFASDKDLAPAQGRKIDLFRLFTAKNISLLNQMAALGLIIPMSLLADNQTKELRQHLLKKYSISTIEAFPQKDNPAKRIFQEAKLPTCVIIVESKSNDNTKMIVTSHPGKLLEEINGSYLCDEQDIIEFDPENLSIPLLKSNDMLVLAKNIFRKNSSFIPIGNLMQTFQGEINETNMDEFLSTEPSVGPKVLRGGNIGRYEFVFEEKQGVDKYINENLYLKRIRGDKSLHTKMSRIGYQRNAALDNWRRLIFSPLPTPSYCFDSISYYIVEGNPNSYILMALLNSKFLEWCFRLTSSNNHVSTREIARLPAFQPRNTTPEAERAALVAQARALYESLTPPPPLPAAGEGESRSGAGELRGGGALDWREWRERWQALWDWADARLPQADERPTTNDERRADERPTTNDERSAGERATEPSSSVVRPSSSDPEPSSSVIRPSSVEQSDAIHDLLAFLAERMIALNKQKQAEAAQFTGWLEAETGGTIDEWAGKTAVQEYWARAWEEIERTLQKNRGKLLQAHGLRSKEADAAMQPLLRAARTRWEHSRAALAPTLHAIAATDRLIDLLVYRLYGLTDAEVDLVEGA